MLKVSNQIKERVLYYLQSLRYGLLLRAAPYQGQDSATPIGGRRGAVALYGTIPQPKNETRPDNQQYKRPRPPDPLSFPSPYASPSHISGLVSESHTFLHCHYTSALLPAPGDPGASVLHSPDMSADRSKLVCQDPTRPAVSRSG